MDAISTKLLNHFPFFFFFFIRYVYRTYIVSSDIMNDSLSIDLAHASVDHMIDVKNVLKGG